VRVKACVFEIDNQLVCRPLVELYVSKERERVQKLLKGIRMGWVLALVSPECEQNYWNTAPISFKSRLYSR
jgi:hypothetical protein